MAVDDRGHRGSGEGAEQVSLRRRRGNGQPKKPMQPPLTPMIDVTFQLLIFFLLACQFRYTEGQIQATLPAVAGPESIPSPKVDPISVTLSPAGDGSGVLIEVAGAGTTGSATELHGMLVQLRERFSDEVPVLIKPTSRVWWNHVVDAFNQAVRAKFKNIAFAPAGT